MSTAGSEYHDADDFDDMPDLSVNGMTSTNPSNDAHVLSNDPVVVTNIFSGPVDISSQDASALGTENTIDLVDSIEGMYRILDLVKEQGSGGLGKTLHIVLYVVYS